MSDLRSWNARIDGLVYGCDYNPEQWPRETWAEDIELMREAGVNLVSVGIFSWAMIEPREGEFDWAWLDEILDLLHQAGIQVALATATASPPPWLMMKHPEILPVTADGRVLGQGGRQAYSVTSPVWRKYADGMARRMAERYGSHPAVALWHVDNEIGCHAPHNHSDDATVAFREWLRNRYDSIDALNEAWGTAFWSQRYGSFDDVRTPVLAPTFPNPGQQLDFARFSSDAGLGHHLALRKVLADVAPEVPATTNFMCSTGTKWLDYASWAPHVDVVANDHYTVAALPDRHVELAFSADLTRGVAGGKPWMLMEHSTSAVNWQRINRAKHPGEMLRNSLSHVARGADAVMFFQWRASKAGAEKFHSAMLPHAGTDSQVWRNTVELGRTLQALAPVRDSVVRNDVALVFDYVNWWAMEIDSHPHNELRYPELVLDWYRALHAEGYTVDVVSPLADLSGYRVVIAPNLYLADEPRAEAMRGVVERGGVFATTWFSGIVDANDHILLGGYPGAFTDLLGVRVEEFCPLQPDEEVGVAGMLGATSGRTWSERTELRGATAHATFDGGVLDGLPALTERRVGEGRAWYVATDLSRDDKRALVRRWAEQAGVAPVLDEPVAGVEAVRRVGDDGTAYLFLLNHNDEAVTVAASGRDLVSGEDADGSVTIPAGGVAVLAS